MLFAIQVLALIAASLRGWGAKPIIIFVLMIVFSFFAGLIAGPDVIGCLQVVDYIIIGVFIVMAIIGKEKEQLQIIGNHQPISTENQPRIKCPHCAEWIMSDANICRYCGNQINAGSKLSEKNNTIDLVRNDEYYYKLGLKYLQSKNHNEAKLNFKKAIQVSSPNSQWYSYSQKILAELESGGQ